MSALTGFLKPWQFVFWAFLAAQTVFAVILFTVVKPELNGNNLFLVQAIPFISTGMAIVGYFIFNNRLKLLQQERDLETKANLYKSASLLKWALFEGGVMLALVGFLISGDKTLYYMGLFLLLHFSIHFPSEKRVLRELEINTID